MQKNFRKIFILFAFLLTGSVCVSAQEKEIPIVDPDKIYFSAFEDLKIHLDRAAENWSAAKDKILYLIVNGKTSANRGSAEGKECLSILKKSRAYLIRKHKIPAKKIKTIYGGNRLYERELAVWLLTPDELPEVR